MDIEMTPDGRGASDLANDAAQAAVLAPEAGVAEAGVAEAGVAEAGTAEPGTAEAGTAEAGAAVAASHSADDGAGTAETAEAAEAAAYGRGAAAAGSPRRGAVPALHFVFLQGMPSPFFARVAAGLRASGHLVTPISLCVGDTLFWPRHATVPYRGTPDEWPAFLGDLLRNRQVTDLVLLGEQRSYHFDAVAVAHAVGVRVSVTDFGYLRPDWITLERDGMSGNSHFPRDLATLHAWAADAPAVDGTQRFADSARSMALGDLSYSFANLLFSWRYPHYQRSDRRPHPLRYFPAIGVRLLRAARNAARARVRVETLRARQVRYFVFPLQLEHDFQIVAYSHYASLADAIHEVLDSFALHTDENTRLVVKLHPWDPGLQDWENLVTSRARALAVAERVDFLDGGDLDSLLQGAAGMITVNSTTAIRALQLGCPVRALGEAIYAIEGLTCTGPLRRFWQAAQPPDARDVDAFLRALAASIQIRGVFFSEPGLSAAVAATVARLSEGTVGVPVAPGTIAGA